MNTEIAVVNCVLVALPYFDELFLSKIHSRSNSTATSKKDVCLGWEWVCERKRGCLFVRDRIRGVGITHLIFFFFLNFYKFGKKYLLGLNT